MTERQTCLDCAEPVKCRGVCMRHYAERRRHGTLPPRRSPEKLVAVSIRVRPDTLERIREESTRSKESLYSVAGRWLDERAEAGASYVHRRSRK